MTAGEAEKAFARAESGEDIVYQPKDTFKAATQGLLVGSVAGVFMSSIQSTLHKQNIGAFGLFTKFGGTTATFAAVGGTYELFKIASANLREKEDPYNSAIGGFVAGGVMGMKVGTIAAVLGNGVMVASVLGIFEATGGRMDGYRTPSDMDEFERKQALRANKRRPIQETIDDIGEGRGIYAPGWQERRAARIKENYGIDVPKS